MMLYSTFDKKETYSFSHLPFALSFEDVVEVFEFSEDLLVELFALPPPDLFPVVLGAFFNPLDFAIINFFWFNVNLLIKLCIL